MYSTSEFGKTRTTKGETTGYMTTNIEIILKSYVTGVTMTFLINTKLEFFTVTIYSIPIVLLGLLIITLITYFIMTLVWSGVLHTLGWIVTKLPLVQKYFIKKHVT